MIPPYVHLACQPVRYRGCDYPSLQVAQWAAFFDLLQWRYTPYPGTLREVWTPDFVLYGKCQRQRCPLYVAHIPGLPLGPETDEGSPVHAVTDVLDQLAIPYEILLVTDAPWLEHPRSDDPGIQQLGWLREESDAPPESWGGCFDREPEAPYWWAGAYFGQWTSEPDQLPRVGFCHGSGSYTDRISGAYDGGHYGASYVANTFLQAAWERACWLIRTQVHRQHVFCAWGQHKLSPPALRPDGTLAVSTCKVCGRQWWSSPRDWGKGVGIPGSLTMLPARVPAV